MNSSPKKSGFFLPKQEQRPKKKNYKFQQMTNEIIEMNFLQFKY